MCRLRVVLVLAVVLTHMSCKRGEPSLLLNKGNKRMHTRASSFRLGAGNSFGFLLLCRRPRLFSCCVCLLEGLELVYHGKRLN